MKMNAKYLFFLSLLPFCSFGLQNNDGKMILLNNVNGNEPILIAELNHNKTEIIEDSVHSVANPTELISESVKEKSKYERMFAWGFVLGGTGLALATPFTYLLIRNQEPSPGTIMQQEGNIIFGLPAFLGTCLVAGGTAMIIIGHKRSKLVSNTSKITIEIDYAGPKIVFKF
jgi:hypothetical protein